MGTYFQVKYQSVEGLDSELVRKQATQAVDDVNQRMSSYRSDSELMRFNRAPINQAFSVSKDFAELVKVSEYISRISGGRYDVSIGPLVNLWGFGPDKRPEKVPSEAEISAAQALVDYRSLLADVETQTLVRKKALFIDLSSIAKGYGVDRMAGELEKLGVHDYLVEVGGEVRMKGAKPGGVAWRIGVEKPLSTERQATIVIAAQNKGIATSGDYRNYYEVDGKRYSHMLDPLTGRPIDHHLVSVTVVDDSTALADGLATMFMVVGAEEGLRIAAQEGIAAYFIEKSAEGFSYTATDSFAKHIVSQ